MKTTRQTWMVVLAALAALPLVACGSDRLGNTTAPSAVPAATPSTTSGVRVTPLESGSNLTVTALVAGTTCPTLQFTIGSYTIATDASTQYEGGTCATIRPGVRVSIDGFRRGDQYQTFTASAIKFESSNSGPRVPVDGESTVTSLVAGTACPTLSFMLGTYTIAVSATTTFEGGTCATIAPGVRVRVTGTANPDGTGIAASTIEFKGGTTPSRDVEGEGVVTSVTATTSCPALQFFIGTYQITLSSSTVFDTGTCADIRVGSRVHVKGATNTGSGSDSDSGVNATRVSVQNDSPGRPVAEGEGRVGTLVSGTSCPTLSFTIEEYTVSVDANTTFVGGTCSDVAAGRHVGVKGIVTAEQQALATKIVFKND